MPSRFRRDSNRFLDVRSDLLYFDSPAFTRTLSSDHCTNTTLVGGAKNFRNLWLHLQIPISLVRDECSRRAPLNRVEKDPLKPVHDRGPFESIDAGSAL